MNDVNCPYCGEGVEINKEETYSPDCIYNIECGSCGCWFSFSPVVDVRFEAHKSPCLNGGWHEFIHKCIETGEGPYEFTACKYCDVDEYEQRLDA